jgi:RNA polymerase sigma factor (sigma-70 family)
MIYTNDAKLLNQYSADASESAFAEIMSRHRRLVYSTCLRELSDPTLAEDATQIVFLILARKAKSLSHAVTLTGWLFKTAKLTAMDLRRRRERECAKAGQLSQEIRYVESTSPSEWDRVDPLLNECLGQLSEKDRLPVLMHYFDQMSIVEISTVLGQKESTVRQRVNRALEKLRQTLVARGVIIPGVTLAALLTENALKPDTAHGAALGATGPSSAAQSTLAQITKKIIVVLVVIWMLIELGS